MFATSPNNKTMQPTPMNSLPGRAELENLTGDLPPVVPETVSGAELGTPSGQADPFELPEERPALRSFGNAGAHAKAKRSERLIRAGMVAGAAVVVAASVFLLVPSLTTQAAPKFDPPVSVTQLATDPAQESGELSLATPVLGLAELEVGAEDVLAAEAAREQALIAELDAVEVAHAKPLPVITLEDVREGRAPVPASMEEALDQIAQLKAMLVAKLTPAAAPRPAGRTARKPASIASHEPQYVSVSVLDISPDRVIVADTAQPNVSYAVTAGSTLPGGATFIGFDTASRLMKTDQGDFLIP